MLERLCLSAGLGTPRGPPGRAGGSGRGQGRLGFSVKAAAPFDPIPGQAVDDGWMDGWMMNTPDLVGLANFAYFCVISFLFFFKSLSVISGGIMWESKALTLLHILYLDSRSTYCVNNMLLRTE